MTENSFKTFTVRRSDVMVASESEQESRNGDHRQTSADPESVKACPKFPASLISTGIKRPVRAVIAWDWVPHVIGPSGILPFRGLLRTVGCSLEVVIERSSREFSVVDRFHRGPSDVQLATHVTACAINSGIPD